MTEEDLEVVLEDAPAEGAEPKPAEAAAPEPQPAPVSADEGLDELKRNLAASEQARQDAERRAAAEAQQRQQAQGEAHRANLSMIDNALAAVATASEALESRYAEAAASGDWSQAAKIQREMAAHEAKRVALEQAKVSVEAQPPRSAPQGDMLEQICAGLSAPSAAWLRQHPQFASSQQGLDAMIAADRLAKGRGLIPDTPDYFRAVERALGVDETPSDRRSASEPIAQPDDEPLSGAARPTGTRTPPPAAPPSRGSEINGTRRNVVTLTAAQKEAADIAGVSYQEYAQQLRALEAETKH